MLDNGRPSTRQTARAEGGSGRAEDGRVEDGRAEDGAGRAEDGRVEDGRAEDGAGRAEDGAGRAEDGRVEDGGADGGSGRVVLLIPGFRYSAERPLLHFAGAVFAKHGWATREVRWPEQPPQRDGQDFAAWFDRLRSFVEVHVGRMLEDVTAPRIALVGKSMGTLAAGLAADRGLPGIWLTPVLRDSPLLADLNRAVAPFLLVGSAADRSWDSAAARSFGRPCYEVDDADHGMEIAGDPVRSADILRDVTIAMDTFVSALCR